jgi:hypothetical protein
VLGGVAAVALQDRVHRPVELVEETVPLVHHG